MWAPMLHQCYATFRRTFARLLGDGEDGDALRDRLAELELELEDGFHARLVEAGEGLARAAKLEDCLDAALGQR